MYNNLFENELKSDIRKIFTLAFDTTRDVILSMDSFFENKAINNGIEKYLFAFAIENAFFDFGQISSSTYESNTYQLNPYGRKTVLINNGANIFTIANTKKINQLPCTAKYKRKLSERNDYYGQMEFNPKNHEIFEQGLYSLISYGIESRGIQHLAFVTPDKSFKKILHIEDLLQTAVTPYHSLTPQEEQIIVRLKKKIKENIPL